MTPAIIPATATESEDADIQLHLTSITEYLACEICNCTVQEACIQP